MMNGAKRAALLRDTAERAVRYLEDIQTRKVAPSAEALERLSVLKGRLPDGGLDSAAIIETLDAIVSPATTGMGGPRFFGFVIGGAFPVTIAANWLATAWDQNTGLFAPTPGTSTIEAVASNWMLDLLGLPPNSGVGFVTGATMANFTCLASARYQVLKQVGWDSNENGIYGAPPIQVIVGEEIHPTAQKALRLLGFGNKQLHVVPVDNQGRMRPDAIPKISAPCILVTQAGNVNTGACDPIGDLCDEVRGNGVWVHVDGAFGLWARAVPEKRHLVDGVDKADSWATDCHKWLNVPYDSGIAFVKDADAHRNTMAIAAAYLPNDPEKRNPSDFTPELSRRARGVDVWAALMFLGRQGVTEMIRSNCRSASLMAERLQSAGFEILNDVVLNQVLVSFGSVAKTERVIEELQQDGTCWCGVTKWQGHTAMRISVSSWATTEQDAEISVDTMIRIARR